MQIKHGLAVRKSHLGWVAFGADEEQIQSSSHQVMNVHLATTVYPTEFWKTESMGVSDFSLSMPTQQNDTRGTKGTEVFEDLCHLGKKKWTVNYHGRKILNSYQATICKC